MGSSQHCLSSDRLDRKINDMINCYSNQSFNHEIHGLNIFRNFQVYLIIATVHILIK